MPTRRGKVSAGSAIGNKFSGGSFSVGDISGIVFKHRDGSEISLTGIMVNEIISERDVFSGTTLRVEIIIPDSSVLEAETKRPITTNTDDNKNRARKATKEVTRSRFETLDVEGE